eukprot:Protomagalhaensia_wolfi_Nauph_80__95@NODE_1054_length_1768_cov_14_226721_g798_i0_p2_GENE_NODE_1054_length_1768_cov_14_226721_g798_i0NODE_1054_length_1768_cov_14_226721_g798_i0_p2_ORF_typecomplete_len137_score16_88_NODE_1054_length_1768_cov_14_226721_g798_i09701380
MSPAQSPTQSGRPQITSKLGGAFLAKLGDYAKEGSKETDKAQSDLPSSLLKPDQPKSPRMTSTDDTSNAASAVQALIRNITCSAAVTDDDLTLKQVITHMVLTDDRRVLFLDPETHRIRSYITPSQLFRFLLACDN